MIYLGMTFDNISEDCYHNSVVSYFSEIWDLHSIRRIVKMASSPIFEGTLDELFQLRE